MKTGLTDFLKYHDIELVEIAGLALDYCVRATCLDAVKKVLLPVFISMVLAQ